MLERSSEAIGTVSLRNAPFASISTSLFPLAGGAWLGRAEPTAAPLASISYSNYGHVYYVPSNKNVYQNSKPIFVKLFYHDALIHVNHYNRVNLVVKIYKKNVFQQT